MESSKGLYRPLYCNSWALIVGIDSYTHFPPLVTAAHGAQAVAAHLRQVLGFNVTEMTDTQPDRESLLRWFAHLRTGPDDRVLFYFAGHGITHNVGTRRKGFLALAASDGYWNSLAIDDILDEAEALPAKHVLYLLDACFSGLALHGRAAESGVDRTLDTLLTRPARYAITAGGEEVVDDSAAGEYSLFTHFLIKALSDKTLQAGGMLRAKEVGLYIEENVSAHRRSHALPNHGYLPGSGDGDFVFSWESGPRLPLDLEMALYSAVTEVRGGAASALLKRLRATDDPELAKVLRGHLEELASTDANPEIRAAARRLLEEEGAPPAEEITGKAEQAATGEAASAPPAHAKPDTVPLPIPAAPVRPKKEGRRKTPMWVWAALPILLIAGGVIAALASGSFGSASGFREDFSAPAYNGTYNQDQWRIYFQQGEDGSPEWGQGNVIQRDGMLVLKHSTGVKSYTGAKLLPYRELTLTAPLVYEARFKMGSAASLSGVAIRIFSDQTDGECSVGSWDAGDLHAQCGVWSAPDGWQGMDPVNAESDTWYTFRFELDPTTMTYTGYVDNKLLGTITLADAGQFQDERYSVGVYVWGAEVVGYVEYIRLNLPPP